MALMRKGAENRHTGETRLNRESSRSHSVFTCVLERQSKNMATGITNVLFSRLNLIDLAGKGGENVTRRHIRHTSMALPTGMELAETLRWGKPNPHQWCNTTYTG
jgi:hypothetical protein